MSFLGSIGRFFTRPGSVGSILFPAAATTINLIEAARAGEGPQGFIRREEATYGIKPSSQAAQMGVNPEAAGFADTRLQGAQLGPYAFYGPQFSGSFIPGGDPWTTDLIYSAEIGSPLQAEISSEILEAETYWGPEAYST